VRLPTGFHQKDEYSALLFSITANESPKTVKRH